MAAEEPLATTVPSAAVSLSEALTGWVQVWPTVWTGQVGPAVTVPLTPLGAAADDVGGTDERATVLGVVVVAVCPPLVVLDRSAGAPVASVAGGGSEGNGPRTSVVSVLAVVDEPAAWTRLEPEHPNSPRPPTVTARISRPGTHLVTITRRYVLPPRHTRRMSQGPRLLPQLAREIAVAAGMVAAVAGLVRRLKGPEARRREVGAAGERRVASELAVLEGEGWRLLHDRRLPGRRANVDHVAVGPGGVWVIETKCWSGRIDVGPGAVRQGRRRADAVLDQVWEQTRAVSALVAEFGVDARPIVCIAGGELSIGRDRSGRRAMGPVEFHAPDALVRRLRLAPVVLSPAQAASVADVIARALPPAAPIGMGPPARAGPPGPAGQAPASATARSPTTG